MLVRLCGWEVWAGRGVGPWAVWERVPPQVNGADFECYLLGVNVVAKRAR